MQTVEPAKGNHRFYAQNWIKANDPENPTATEIYNGRGKFKAILFLQRPEKCRYSKLIQYLK